SSLFSNVEILWNEKTVESYNNHFPIISFFKQLFGTSAEAKKYLTQLCGFSRPTSPLVDSTDDINAGRLVRKNMANLSRLIRFNFPLETDLRSSRRLIPPNVSVTVRLTHATDSAR
ncbi:MAG: hypothetical protein GY820_03485, partial [Gammaproteobacteria bacterium]|nr:hypothetical protein [Gammaproteobacteria bacterium]